MATEAANIMLKRVTPVALSVAYAGTELLRKSTVFGLGGLLRLVATNQEAVDAVGLHPVAIEAPPPRERKEAPETRQPIQEAPAFPTPSAEEIMEALDQQLSRLQKQTTHPIYGTLLYEQGDGSKVYSTPVSTFCQQARELTAKQPFSLPGIITVYTKAGEKDTTPFILDGQHRAAGLKILFQKGLVGKDEHVLVSVHENLEEEQAAKLFTEINQAQSVSLLEMPGVAEEWVKATLEEGLREIRSEYGSMFRPGTRCRPPHVNIDNLKDDLFQADVMERFSITDAYTLATWLRENNEKLAELSDAEWAKRRGVDPAKLNKSFKAAVAKARENGFYLGLDKKWML
eukprot:scaffold1973_cov399-Prasinococcus_capsulatus_cf.AAC.14